MKWICEVTLPDGSVIKFEHRTESGAEKNASGWEDIKPTWGIFQVVVYRDLSQKFEAAERPVV